MTSSNFYSVVWTTMGVLAFGIAFSVVLTLYVKEKSAHVKTSTTTTSRFVKHKFISYFYY